MFIEASLIAIASAAVALEAAPYSAFEIPPGQTIKVRVNPIADAPVVVEIPPSATDITLTGVFGSIRWTQVIYAGKLGWVRDHEIGLGTPGGFQIPTHLDCTSRDGDWSFRLLPALLLFRRTKENSHFVVSDVLQNLDASDRITVAVRSPSEQSGMSIVFERRPDHSIVATLSAQGKTGVGACHPV